MTNPKFTGVWIPREVFQHKSLSPTAKFVYGIVDSLDNEDGCYASNGYLSVSLGVSDRQIRSLLKELEDTKLIVRILRDGKRIIRTVEKVALTAVLVVQGGGSKLPRGRKKTSTGGGSKLPTYIKEYNKVDKDTPQTPKGAMEDLPQGGSPLPFSSDEFSKAWFRWVDYRKEIKKTLKQSSVDLQWEQMKLWGEKKSIDSINQSITNGWTGLFESRNFPNQKQPLTATDHNEF